MGGIDGCVNQLDCMWGPFHNVYAQQAIIIFKISIVNYTSINMKKKKVMNPIKCPLMESNNRADNEENTLSL